MISVAAVIDACNKQEIQFCIPPRRWKKSLRYIFDAFFEEGTFLWIRQLLVNVRNALQKLQSTNPGPSGCLELNHHHTVM